MHDLTAFNGTILIAAVFIVAFFYSSVGHGGATGYLAALALVGVAPASAKVAVLIANILVASIAFWRFYQAGHERCIAKKGRKIHRSYLASDYHSPAGVVTASGTTL